MIWPCVIGILYSSVSEDNKSLAGGVMLTVAGFGNAAGPLIGGALTEFASWRWVLFVNVPVCIIAGLITYLEVDKQETKSGKSDVDYYGILTVSASLMALLYALTVSPTWGWTSYKTISLLVAFVVFMVLFLMIESRKDDGLIPKDVMRNFQFMIVGAVMLTFVPGFFAILLYVTQYLEKFRNYNPIEAGAVLVPMLAVFSLTSAFSNRIYNKIGPRLSIFIGMALNTIGVLCVVFFGFGASVYGLIPGYIIAGVGLGFAVPSITTAGISAVKESRGSLAGGILYMFQLVGGAFGLSVATTIFTDFAQNDLLKSLSHSSLHLSKTDLADITNFIIGSGSAQKILESLGQQEFGTVFSHMKHAYITGVSSRLIFTSILSSIGAALAILFVRSKVSKA